jgi:UDP-glucose 4-epimerase
VNDRADRVTVLVTGSRGYLGTWVVANLEANGFRVHAFDLSLGDDVGDLPEVLRAAENCTAIVHLAAIPHDEAGTPEDIMATNVLGTWHVLLAARAVGAARVVHLSSAMALGVFQSRVMPTTLPIDDDYEASPLSAYSLSKRLGEILCATTSADGGPVTVCLRSTRIVGPDERGHVGAEVEERVTAHDPICDFAAWVDVRDVAEAVHLALTVPLSGHLTCLLAADDTIAALSPRRLRDEVYASVPWRGGDDAETLVLSTMARAMLGWAPRYRWTTEGDTAP